MTYDNLKKLAEQRRSIRYFADKPVTKDTIVKLLEIAHLAPNIENIQPWHFHVILDTELKTKMMAHVCYGDFVVGAGAFIVVSCNTASYPATRQTVWNPHEIDYSCVAAMSFMMLAATSLDLGTCFVSLHHGEPHTLLKLSPSHVVVGGLMVGHLRPGEETVNDGHIRKPLKETYTIYG